ncbi:MAG TPA: WD40 repeat domain-containing protein [Terriglobia bacterium]|nr:WD40 repeat domain-containing protein [Terriglobia bacterium]
MRRSALLFIAVFLTCRLIAGQSIQSEQQGQSGQAATAPQPAYDWQHELRIDGHLALHYSPDGSFSPDGSILAVVGQRRVILLDLAHGRGLKALHPSIPGIEALDIHSANYVSPERLLILANGLMKLKGQAAPFETPELVFQWDITQDALTGKVEELGAKGGFLPPVYFPRIHRVALYKDSAFTLWDPLTGLAGKYALPQLTHPPHLFAFSLDGRWLLLAQIETSANPNPIVVSAKDHAFTDVLSGHEATVLSMTFSRDGKLLETSCEDGKVRVWSVPDWKLLQTLTGNAGPVHWAEFSPDGSLVAAAGEDNTARIWDVATGKLIRTFEESKQPLLTVAFSPDGKYLAATSQNEVHVWVRKAVN